MNGRLSLSFLDCLGVIASMFVALAAPIANATDNQFATGVVRFALDTGNVERVVGLAAKLEGESADYLQARLLLASGQVDKARAGFERVFSGTSHRGETALALAEMAQREGDLTGAENWYQQARRTGFGEVLQKAFLGLAELARIRGRTDLAGQYLAKMDDGYWSAVGYMNLAADFVRDDLDSSRALVSLRVAMAMAAKDSDSDRSRALLDLLYLRAGYLALGGEDYDKAIDFLEKVSLESYHTPQALYLHGLALSRKGNHRAAMQSWHRAKKFPLAFPGVSDAWIGMGRGYDLSGYPGQAGESWLAAIAAYEGERVTLGKLAERIAADGAYKALVLDARSDDIQWFLADSRTLTQPRMAYLLRFMEEPGAQMAVRRVARLDEMIATLDESRYNLQVFMEAIENYMSTTRLGGERVQTDSLEKQQGDLTARYDHLAGVAATPAQTAELLKLKQALVESRRQLAALTQWGEQMPESLEKALNEARVLRDETEGLRQRILILRDQAAGELDALALAFVETQTQRMTHALDKTEQQIAHLYEYLALENLGEGTP